MIQNMFVKAIIKEELAVIISKIREETRTDDDTPVKLKEAIQVGDWEMTRKDPEIAPFYPVKTNCLSQMYGGPQLQTQHNVY